MREIQEFRAVNLDSRRNDVGATAQVSLEGKLALPGNGVPKLELGNKNGGLVRGTRLVGRSLVPISLVSKLRFGSVISLEAPVSRDVDGLNHANPVQNS